MLIFISDLHFVDGSAGKHNIPTDAFRIFLKDISGICQWLKETKGSKIEEIKLVFLGDIFDLLRTEKWFDYPPLERPWGDAEDKIKTNAVAICDALLAANKDTFDLFGGNLKKQFDLPVEPERIYVPGNHDRLCNIYTELRERVCRALGVQHDTNTPFDSHFRDSRYGVFARHGHEFDIFNYEGSTDYTYEDYSKIPIGDPITTEIITKLPWKIMQRAEVKSLPDIQQDAIKRNFQDLENIRPFSAIIEWLLYQVNRYPDVKQAIDEVVDEVIQEFNNLPFVKDWYKRHDKWYNFMDEADKVQAVLFLLEKFSVFSIEKIMPLVGKMKGFFQKDDLLEGALNEYKTLPEGFNYILYGHTHVPLHEPLKIVNKGQDENLEYIYLNTGTWRVMHYKAKEGIGYSPGKNLTYHIFYLPEERKTNKPSFESWTGRLKTV
jgi:UDP-2,3-diacylglucosamine pyrophosphatase LpxH